MTTKTIKISEENYRWLVEISGDMQKELGRPVSIDKALKSLHKRKVSDLAGSLKISDKEIETMFKDLSKG